MKRTADVVLSMIGLLLGGPLICVVLAWVWIREGRPVTYSSCRVGLNGREFRVFKIRTMIREAESHDLGSVTVADDSRVTSTGRVLRRWKIDELPQLVNILIGDMSLVGPRPETPEYVARYTEEQRKILKYRPGLTSPATIAFFDEAEFLRRAVDPRAKYVDDVMPEEIRMDLEYFEHATIGSDMRVLVETGRRFLRRDVKEDT